MSDAITTWQACKVEVTARLIPRYFWSTASIDVFLDNECVLRTGGKLDLIGSHVQTFTHGGSTHTAELSWGLSSLLSFPYKLQIDGMPVCESRVRVQNAVIVLIGYLTLIISSIWLLYLLRTHVAPMQ